MLSLLMAVDLLRLIKKKAITMKIKYPKSFYTVIGLVAIIFTGYSLSGLAGDGISTIEEAYPGFSTSILRSAKLYKLDKGIVLEAPDIKITEAQIKELLEQSDEGIREELEKNLFLILEQKAMLAVLAGEARLSGAVSKDLEDARAIQEFFGRRFKDIKVSEDEAKIFYRDNKSMIGDTSFEDVREAINELLIQQKQEAAFNTYLAELEKKVDIHVNEDWFKAQYALAMDNPVDKARMSGKPSMIEFGATGCIPCDRMQPILESLRKKFPESLNVVFVNVREKQILGARFGIETIPIQAFYDKNGKEVFRHVGFYEEEEILKQLVKLGIK